MGEPMRFKAVRICIFSQELVGPPLNLWEISVLQDGQRQEDLQGIQ
jgi:hypothetical protein